MANGLTFELYNIFIFKIDAKLLEKNVYRSCGSRLHVRKKSSYSCLILDDFLQLFTFNPLSPHDALKHHFTSLKTDLIFLELGVLESKFP